MHAKSEEGAGSRRGAQKLYPWAWQEAWSMKLHPWVGNRRGALGEADDEAASMGRQQAQSTRQSEAPSCIHKRLEGIIIIIIENRWAAGAVIRTDATSRRPGASLSDPQDNIIRQHLTA